MTIMPPSRVIASNAAAPTHGVGEVSPWLLRWAHLVPPGARALDIACGYGRHARWLAARGAVVSAIDRDTAALASLPVDITAVAADIEAGPWPLPDDARFDVVVVTNYLHRALLARMAGLVAPGGVLLYETFAQGNEMFGKPSNPDFLLAPGELLEVARASGLRVAGYEDGLLGAPRAACVQRLCATRAPTGGNPSYAALYEPAA